jgi:conjugal transfer pilus assembly protein TrbC
VRTRLLVLSYCLQLSTALAAAPSPVITDEDIERMRQTHKPPVITQEMMDAVRARVPTPSMEQVNKQAVPKTPRIEINTKVETVDLAALARKYDEQQQPEQKGYLEPTLFVFVSFSMPSASLERIIEQAEAAGAVLVSRGLYQNNLSAHAEKVASALKNRRVGWEMDPRLYDEYAVESVPAMVLIKPSRTPNEYVSCTGPELCEDRSFVKLTGDVTLDYGLDLIVRQRPDFADTANTFLSRIRGH